MLSVCIIAGCGSIESTATSLTTGDAGETPTPVQPTQPAEAPVDAPDPARARDVALAFLSGRYGEQTPALGLAGNVSERVADTPAPYTTERQVNPSVTSGDGELEIARGGSWYYFPDYVRSANRFQVRGAGAMADVGFRCVVPGSSQ